MTYWEAVRRACERQRQYGGIWCVYPSPHTSWQQFSVARGEWITPNYPWLRPIVTVGR